MKVLLLLNGYDMVTFEIVFVWEKNSLCMFKSVYHVDEFLERLIFAGRGKLLIKLHNENTSTCT